MLNSKQKQLTRRKRIRCVCVCCVCNLHQARTLAFTSHFPQWTRLPCSRATFHCESTVMCTMELCQIFWHSTNVWQNGNSCMQTDPRANSAFILSATAVRQSGSHQHVYDTQIRLCMMGDGVHTDRSEFIMRWKFYFDLIYSHLYDIIIISCDRFPSTSAATTVTYAEANARNDLALFASVRCARKWWILH